MSNIYKLFLISIPYGIYFLLTYIDSVWFFFGDRTYYRWILMTGYLIHVLYLINFQKFTKYDYFQKKIIGIFLSILCLMGFVLFPIQDLNLGDGILLIENAILENLAYGYTVIPDEILEGLIHSVVFNLIKSFTLNPMVSYRILSTLIGAIFLVTIYIFFKNEKSYPLVVLLFMCQGGSLLFYGYTENYTIASLFIFLTILYGFNKIKENDFRINSILGISLLAGLSAVTHLISGFMLIGLIYFCILACGNSEKFYKILYNNLFYKNAIVASITAFSIIVPIYAYFFIFSDLRIEVGLAHATHPPFLSPKKIFSSHHFKDLALEAIFMILPLAFSLKYIYLTEREILKKIVMKKEFLFVILIFIGFFIHFFTYNPLLGYPADWDLMGFIWIPILIIVIYLMKEYQTPFIENIPLFISLYLIILYNAFTLRITEDDAKRISFLEESIQEFLVDYRQNEMRIDPKYKKSYLHTGYFLFRTNKKIKLAGDWELLKRNESLEKEFEGGKILEDREKWKVFLTNATEFHHLYLERIEKNHK
jgi:hypothetical protein